MKEMMSPELPSESVLTLARPLAELVAIDIAAAVDAKRGCSVQDDRPAGRPPRKPPVYYVWPASPDHTVFGKDKAAGRRPAVFAKSGVWSAGRG